MKKQLLVKENKTQCAWCNAEQGIPQGNGSHGICPRHAAAMIKGRKTKRVA